MERLEVLKGSASAGVPFSEVELDSAVSSMRLAAGESKDSLDWRALRAALQEAAHEPYKDWAKTGEAAAALGAAFLRPGSAEFRQVFQRVLRDGQWEQAADASAQRAAGTKPWIVLVTGLNGIRKTTCMYQPWFRDVLREAMEDHVDGLPSTEELPDGNNSFFRQLDHIIATVANEEFRTLYTVSDVDRYSALKDGIFGRYRKIAEMWGMLLISEARRQHLNVMVETSGRDVGMFHYIDHCFPDGSYRKLALHFEINDVSFAERSVDERMLREIEAGQRALAGTVDDIIKVNAGGPYGSKVLRGVQADSDRVWETEVRAGRVAQAWYKASFSITGQEAAEWTARASSSPPGVGEHPILRV